MLRVLLIPGPFPTICRFVCSSLSPFQRDQNLQLQARHPDSGQQVVVLRGVGELGQLLSQGSRGTTKH